MIITAAFLVLKVLNVGWFGTCSWWWIILAMCLDSDKTISVKIKE